MKRFVIWSIIVFLFAACAHVISKEGRSMAQRDVSFKELLANTDSYISNIFILGGVIAKTTNKEKGTEIEVVQTPLDSYGNIIDRDISHGRFLVTTAIQLDPLIYATGRKITISGKLTGSTKKLIGEFEYLYPVLEAKEIFLWKDEKYHLYQPEFPYSYDPYYYGYPYYWDRPYWWDRPYLYPYFRP